MAPNIPHIFRLASFVVIQLQAAFAKAIYGEASNTHSTFCVFHSERSLQELLSFYNAIFYVTRENINKSI